MGVSGHGFLLWSKCLKSHPKAFLGWIKLIVIMVPISMILYLLMQNTSEMIWLIVFSIISFILVFLSILITWEEFFNYKEFIDIFFIKRSYKNVVVKFKPKGEIKNIILFSSHIDSALQFNLLKWLKWGFIPLAFGAIFIMLIWLILSTISLIFVIIGLIQIKDIFFFGSILDANNWLSLFYQSILFCTIG